MDEPGYAARKRFEEAYAHPHAAYATPEPMLEEDILREKVRIPEASGATGYEEPNYRPPAAVVPEGKIPGATNEDPKGLPGSVSAVGPPKGSEGAKRLAMDPHLQFQCGPMLKYDTVVDGVWHGFAMVVIADEGSDYSRTPRLSLRYGGASGMDKLSISGASGEQCVDVEAVVIFQYHAVSGPNTFFRFKIEIPLAEQEMPIYYRVNGGHELQFWVPGRTQNMRWMGHSCNGFSGGVDADAFNGPSPLWDDFLKKHKERPFHVIVGGGDQIYCDPISQEPELHEYITSKDEKFKRDYVLTDAMKFAMDRFFFAHYVTWYRQGAFARTIASVPQLNILDDHDLIDGFGSYPDELMSSAVFSHIGARGFFWYLLFQNMVVDTVDGTSPEPRTHPHKSMIIGGEGAFVPFPTHNFLSYLGPDQAILLMDCRAERKLDRICSDTTYSRCFQRIREQRGIKHLTILLGVPIAYPRMVFLENALDSKLNPLVLLGKVGLVPGAVNKFNGQAELLDDMNDHWCASKHKKERNWFIEQCQTLALECKIRISFLSGDVHAAAVGRLKWRHHRIHKRAPEDDHRYMLNIVSSAIVNTPPPPAVGALMNKLGQKTHKSLYYIETAEDMVEMWDKDTDGSKLKGNLIMLRRNYVTTEIDEQTKELVWTFRVERKQGEGTTVPYEVRAPAVRNFEP